MERKKVKMVNRRTDVCKDWLIHLLSRPKLTFDSTLDLLLPKEGGVYHIGKKGTEEHSLYVGETSNLRNCVLKGHLNRRNSFIKKKLIESKMLRSEERAKQYLQKRCFVQYVLIENARFRTLVKHFVISVLNPKLND